jgi:O-antigen/teichoic acid export membrane protein
LDSHWWIHNRVWILISFGIWGAIIKYVAEFRAKRQRVRSKLLNLLCICVAQFRYYPAKLSWLHFLFGFNIPIDQQETATRLFSIMGLGAGISLLGMAPMAVLRGLQRFDVINIIDVIVALFTALVSVCVLLLGGGVLELAAVNIGGILLVLALSIWFVHRLAPELRFKLLCGTPRLVKFVLAYSWPLFLRHIATSLKGKTDEITIGVFLPVSMMRLGNLGRKMSDKCIY